MFYIHNQSETNTHFLSPDRRGRGFLVAPGFCPVSGDTFSCGRKNSKTTVQFFLEISTLHS